MHVHQPGAEDDDSHEEGDEPSRRRTLRTASEERDRQLERLLQQRHPDQGRHNCPRSRQVDINAANEAHLAPGISVTVKNHVIFAQAEFCVARDRGLGLFTEQASESVHADFSAVWSRYKVSSANNAYSKQLLRAVEVYNCRHM